MKKNRDFMRRCVAVEAVYRPSPIVDYQDNPLIEALPPETSIERLAETLPERPPYDESERSLPLHLRTHCALRLLSYFEPLGRHYDIGTRLDLMIRAGYRTRSPMTPEFRRRLQDIYRLNQNQELVKPYETAAVSAASMSLIGVSGTGKTRSLRRTLAQYPQVIWHPKHQLYQIPWLVVECPHDGSVKQLCLAFFKAVDKVLGSDYEDRYKGKSVTAEERLLEVAAIVCIHAVGVIVFDELQHIRPAGPEGVQKLFNFFVTLMNLSEAPIVLVGTMSAQRLLQVDFRQARRGTGFGGLVWGRFERCDEWNYLMESVWKYQWTQKSSLFSEEVAATLYERTQGVVDLAIKLYLLSQYRAMVTGIEEVTPELMNRVADDEFKLLQPMLDALASGDSVRIAKYDDLRPLEIEEILEREQFRMSERVNVQALREQYEREQEGRRAQIMKALLAAGLSEELVSFTLTTAFDSTSKQVPDENVKKRSAGSGRKPPASIPKRRSAGKRTDTANFPECDLRRMVFGGSAAASGYETLLTAGVVRGPMAIFVA